MEMSMPEEIDQSMMERLDDATVQAAFQAALDDVRHDEIEYGTTSESRVFEGHLGQNESLNYLHLSQNDVDLSLLPQTGLHDVQNQPDSSIFDGSTDFGNQWLWEPSNSYQIADASFDVDLIPHWIPSTVGQDTTMSQFLISNTVPYDKKMG